MSLNSDIGIEHTCRLQAVTTQKLQILTDIKKKSVMVDMGESPSFVLRFHPDGDDQVQVSRGHTEIVPLNLRRSVASVSICVLLSTSVFRVSVRAYLLSQNLLTLFTTYVSFTSRFAK